MLNEKTEVLYSICSEYAMDYLVKLYGDSYVAIRHFLLLDREDITLLYETKGNIEKINFDLNVKENVGRICTGGSCRI